MKKDISVSVVPTQALEKLRSEASTARAEADAIARAAKLHAAAEVAAAERRARDAEDQDGVKTEGQRIALRRVGDQIRYSPGLYPWMRAYAEWLTLECIEPPTRSARRVKARTLAHAPINDHNLKSLEARPDFVAYMRDLEAGPLERARRRFESAYPEYVEAHRDALNQARDAGDYATVARIAEPVLDRVAPKRAENAAAAQVTVVLAPEQMKAIATYEAPPMLVETATADAETP